MTTHHPKKEKKILLIGTRSQGKLIEVQDLLQDLPFQIKTLAQTSLPISFDVQETATTFEGNAIIKAMTLGIKTGYLTLAEDAGLEVEALDGKPGVYSKRFYPGTDTDRNYALLKLMHNKKVRTARFHCAIAIYNPLKDLVQVCQGQCEGHITTGAKGNQGFGYDPIFFSTDLQKTMAQATIQEKSQISHRARALAQAKTLLAKLQAS